MEQKVKIYTGDEDAVSRGIRAENANGWIAKQISTSCAVIGQNWSINVVVLFEKPR